ncbi:ribonuclease H-like domain-containing protein [Irpex lacteus]|nr:ribonuclease H-like domain-containing protein [Irpex lacteus]
MSGRGRGRGRGGRGGGGDSASVSSTTTAGGRGGAVVRGGGPGRGGVLPADHVQTVGVKRKGFGTAGQAIEVWTNHFPVDIPQDIIHHYDAMTPSEQTNPLTLNMELIRHLQEVVAPHIFTPPAVYDGRKNMFARQKLPFTEGSMTFDVSLPQQQATSGTQTKPAKPPRSPKVYKIKLTWVAQINPEITARFLEGKQSHDNEVLTTITALNVVVRHEPTMRWPFNVRSFFTDRETVNIGSGIVLWRGYFQSVRPGQGRMYMNIDITPSKGFPAREHQRVQRFLQGAKIKTRGSNSLRTIKKLSSAGANNLRFTLQSGQTLTVAAYFQQTYNQPLAYPDLPCVELHSGALIPLELCTMPPGQIMRKQVPSDRTKDVLNFATKKPAQRLQSIRDGLGVLQYGQSEYVRQFGLHVEEQPQSVRARVLPAPTLKYGVGSRQPNVTPRDGAWNMIDKKFYQPKAIQAWGWIIYERENRFNNNTAQQAIASMIKACRSVGNRVLKYSLNLAGMLINDERPEVMWATAQVGRMPDLLVFVLPENAADTYTAIKHVGDVLLGVATQCLKSGKAYKANDQYYANVCLKLNVKLGGINTIPDARAVSILTDPHNPTLVMGADVIHPAAHSEGRPSFTALVGNVDSDQPSFRAIELSLDGVSEGQFKQVLEKELPLIQAACKKVGVAPKITVIVVGKRHHVRFFPKTPTDADRSGNCRAGTVSHGGLLGTSRPAHYNVLYDENDFTVDGLQSLSFTLCHVYARSTRSVSIPAPVYYADIVCSRAKNHYSPDSNLEFEESDGRTADGSTGTDQLQAYKQQFRPIHANSALVMYFS